LEERHFRNVPFFNSFFL